MKDNKFHLGKITQDFNKLKQQLPKKIADESRSYFMKSFPQNGFNQDGSVQKWKEVDRRTPGTNAYKYPKNKKLSRRTKPILVATGRLQRSIRITQLSWNRSVIATDVPYAKYHNKGTSKIPKRKFMGKSRNLNKRIERLIKKELKKLFK